MERAGSDWLDQWRRSAAQQRSSTKKIRAGGMVDHQERDVIEVVGLPELSRDANVVATVPRDELIATNLDPPSV